MVGRFPFRSESLLHEFPDHVTLKVVTLVRTEPWEPIVSEELYLGVQRTTDVYLGGPLKKIQ